MENITRDNFTKLWDYSNPAETEQRFRALLPQTEEVPAYRCEVLTQLARTLGLQRKFDDAHSLLDDAKTIIDGEESSGFERPTIRYLLERGRAYRSSGNVEKSRPLFLEAWEIGLASKEDNLAVDAAHMMGIIESVENSLAWNEKACDLAESSSDPIARRWLGSLYNNIGVTYLYDQQYEKALYNYQKGLDWLKENNGSEKAIRIARWTVARAKRGLGQLDEALTEQRELEQLAEQAGEKSGFVFEEIAECLHALEREEEAKPYFARAYSELAVDSYLVTDEPDRLERLRVMGGVEG